MIKSQVPPTLTFISKTVLVKPLGPHQFLMCSGFVHTSQTNSTGAFKTREIMISLSAVADAVSTFSFSGNMSLSFCARPGEPVGLGFCFFVSLFFVNRQGNSPELLISAPRIFCIVLPNQ